MADIHVDPSPGTGAALRTYSWVVATHGRLTTEQRKMVKAAVRASYGTTVKGLLSWPVRRSKPRAEVPIAPDSRLAKRAEEAAADQGQALVGHGYRTWILGSSLASCDGCAIDDEMLYVASLLHDTGLMTEVAGEDFTLRSARIVIDVCEQSQLTDQSVTMALADAVVAHATPGLLASENAVGYYVQSGAMADLAGLRMWDLPRHCLRDAYAIHPASGIHRDIIAFNHREARDVPEGRFAVLDRAGLSQMVRFSPTRLL